MRPSLDEYVMNLLRVVATRSTCARRSVGAVITDDSGHILSTGYNGVPPGFAHCVDSLCAGALDEAGNNRRCEAIHAETNAITQLRARFDDARRLYCTCTPCFDCCKLILTTPIKRVVVFEEYADKSGLHLLARGDVIVYKTEYDALMGRCFGLKQLELD